MRTRLGKVADWERVAREAGFQPSKMAALCFVSDRQLQRFFQSEFQTTPSRWLRELQCRMAKNLIARGLSTKAVSAELKFGNESHFCREFKKMFAVPPQTFSPTYVPKVQDVAYGQECRL
jgi:AraC-like DNA-binding protein